MKGKYKEGDIVVAIKDFGCSLREGSIYKVIYQYNDGWVKLVPINKLDTNNEFEAKEICIEYVYEPQEVAMKRLEFTDSKWISATYS